MPKPEDQWSRMHDAASKVAMLLRAPEPGLLTWNLMLNDRLADLLRAMGVRDDVKLPAIWAAIVDAGLTKTD